MNAKEEFIYHTAGKTVKCATVTFGYSWGYEDDESVTHNLPVGYTQEEYDVFLHFLDREYHNGYGGQELFGTIWFENDRWSDRGEYDGSEWWDYHTCPSIPESLIKC
jgi:hypothetical protein